MLRLSRAAWIGVGIGARLLMIAVLAMSVQLTTANHTRKSYQEDYYKLQSYTYAVAAAVIAMAGSVLQIPVGVYLLCKSKRTTPSVLVLDISLCADVVATVLLASGVGAGFGATNDVLTFVDHATWDKEDTKQDFIDYYRRGTVPVVFLFVGTVLCAGATVVSARLRARATRDGPADI